MKKWAVLLLLIGLALSGCNTMAGVGKDLEKAGEAIQDSAN
ncbi:MAG: entericidin A/B family lipoprotein [Desulfuromonadaceae bacterium]|nr:entericidin A/B family lipoprotein [Desulfuromonadaceae bacterium]